MLYHIKSRHDNLFGEIFFFWFCQESCQETDANEGKSLANERQNDHPFDEGEGGQNGVDSYRVPMSRPSPTRWLQSFRGFSCRSPRMVLYRLWLFLSGSFSLFLKVIKDLRFRAPFSAHFPSRVLVSSLKMALTRWLCWQKFGTFFCSSASQPFPSRNGN